MPPGVPPSSFSGYRHGRLADFHRLTSRIGYCVRKGATVSVADWSALLRCVVAVPLGDRDFLLRLSAHRDALLLRRHLHVRSVPHQHHLGVQIAQSRSCPGVADRPGALRAVQRRRNWAEHSDHEGCDRAFRASSVPPVLDPAAPPFHPRCLQLAALNVPQRPQP